MDFINEIPTEVKWMDDQHSLCVPVYECNSLKSTLYHMVVMNDGFHATTYLVAMAGSYSN